MRVWWGVVLVVGTLLVAGCASGHQRTTVSMKRRGGLQIGTHGARCVVIRFYPGTHESTIRPLKHC
jgi:hypothetical protein